jgi:ribosomal protein L40E
MDDTASLETPEDPRKRDLVSVGNYPNSLSAESFRSCLEMEGVEAFVFDGEIANMNGLYIAAFGGVKVMVARADRERAVKILDSADFSVLDDVVDADDEIAPDGVHCEKCHSKDVRTREFWDLGGGSVSRFVARTFGSTRVTRCRECGFAVRF